MKRSKYSIAALVGSMVLITLLLFLLIFNLVISYNIRTEARAAVTQTLEEASVTTYANAVDVISNLDSASNLEEVIGNVLDKDSEESVSTLKETLTDEDRTLYTADSLFVPESDKLLASELEMLFSEKERRILKWCSENDASELKKEKIDEQIYYIQTSTVEGGSDKIIAYVDVTGEYAMIRRVNIIFFIAAVAIGLFGTFAGYMLGKKMEQTQLIQKQFFENTSHELKTPLTAIRGYAEGIEKGVITDYPKTGRVINAQVEQMSSLVEGILSIAKLESGSMPLEKEELSLPDFLQDCLMPLEGTVKSRGLLVELELSETKVLADPAQMEHAITNLLTNAMKYAISRIRIRCHDGELILWNDAAGLDEEELQHIFDRFYTGKNGNTGIGLALAKEIIELHGWTIQAENAEDGVAFRIRWPGGSRAGAAKA